MHCLLANCSSPNIAFATVTHSGTGVGMSLFVRVALVLRSVPQVSSQAYITLDGSQQKSPRPSVCLAAFALSL
jgi:hypothetical protein